MFKSLALVAVLGACGGTPESDVSGIPGPQGEQGIEGPAGPMGLQGTPGRDGLPGVAGVSGPQGPQGNDGTMGPQGLQGDIGPQGIPGLLGQQGIPGVIGPIGATGAQGPAGKDGISNMLFVGVIPGSLNAQFLNTGGNCYTHNVQFSTITGHILIHANDNSGFGIGEVNVPDATQFGVGIDDSFVPDVNGNPSNPTGTDKRIIGQSLVFDLQLNPGVHTVSAFVRSNATDCSPNQNAGNVFITIQDLNI